MSPISTHLLTIFLFIFAHSSCDITTETLCVNQVTFEGFGDDTNRYAFAMQTFKGSVMVSTLNAVHVPSGITEFALGKEFETKGTQIYQGNMNNNSSWNWTQIESRGLGNIWNFGLRKFLVTGNYIYGVTANYRNGFEIWRSNGQEFEHIMTGGFGDTNNLSGRGMIVFDGYLYIGVENRVDGAKLFRRMLTENGFFAVGSLWQEIIRNGFSDVNNIWIGDLIEFNGYLYAGTLNENGMQLWRSQDGVLFDNVFKNGMNGTKSDRSVMKLYIYNGRLYIGTMNILRGASLLVNDDSDGLSFVPVFVRGNGNRWNSYVWYIQSFDERLYVGTLDLSEDGYGVPGFDLFSSKKALPDSNDWLNETLDGFGHSAQIGIRTMTVMEDGDTMMIGSATDQDEHGCIVFAATSVLNNDEIYAAD